MLRLPTLLTVVACTACFAQNSITGKVVDELGLPLYMASIHLDGTDQTVFTDIEGNFTLESEKAHHWKVNIRSHGYRPKVFFILEGGSMETVMLEFDATLREIIGIEPSGR